MKINGFFVAEWDNGTEIIAKAVINLKTKEVEIGDFLDYGYVSHLKSAKIIKKFVIIGENEYPCNVKIEQKTSISGIKFNELVIKMEDI